MSSFTKHTAIAPTDTPGIWENLEDYEYYSDLFSKRITIKVPKGYRFDGTSIPNILIGLIGFFMGMFYNTGYFFFLVVAVRIQKVETDTLNSAGIHDYGYTNQREIGRLKLDIIFLESLIVKTIPNLLKEKKYLLAFMYIIKYIMMYIGLFIASWFVWYKITKKIKVLFN